MAKLEGYDGFKIRSEGMLDVFEQVLDCAGHGHPMILFGPSGAGKEFLSRYYFAQYKKKTNCRGSFISLNCAQVVPESAHSILFGHVKGSFTDAYNDHSGVFELAKGGVLFLDEIGDLDKSLQTRLNRAMDEENPDAFKLGSEEAYSTKDVLVICATEQPKKKLNDSLLFRAGHQIQVPGLDERDEDVEEAIRHFCFRAINKRLDRNYLLSQLLNRNKHEISEESLNDPRVTSLIHEIASRLGPFVKSRDWPGNFRALRAAVDSGIIRAKKLSSSDIFIDDIEHYFLHHLSSYSIDDKKIRFPVSTPDKSTTQAGIGDWMLVLNNRVPGMDDTERIRLSQFLSEFEDLTFKRKIFEQYMNLSTRNSQIRIKELLEKDILAKVSGKGYRYCVSMKQKDFRKQSINPALFMELPESSNDDSLLEKNLEAQGIIENSRGLFVSDEDTRKRESFIGSLGASLKEDHDVIYFSFKQHTLEDFISACINHLLTLNMEGWFRKIDDDKLELKEKISGLSGYFIQSLSRQRKTIIILEGLDVFSTSESQALIEQMIYYWSPVQFVLGSCKQSFLQGFSNSDRFTEVKLPS